MKIVAIRFPSCGGCLPIAENSEKCSDEKKALQGLVRSSMPQRRHETIRFLTLEAKSRRGVLIPEYHGGPDRPGGGPERAELGPGLYHDLPAPSTVNLSRPSHRSWT